jgi:putative ABC transport system ATP-binding protein
VYVQVTPPDEDVLWGHALVKSHQGTPALRGVSIGVRAGEVLALTGPHGSGKTTLLHCLGAIEPPDDGELWFQGAPVHKLPRAARERLRREFFGYVGPHPALVPELTARENAALPLMLAGAGRREAYTAATEWLERLDVADCARKRPAALRQEQRQRIAVARALAHHPAVLLADEPTAPLHREDADQVLRILATAARSHGISLVLASTDPAAARYADRVATLSDGVLSAPVAARALAGTAAWAGPEPVGDAPVGPSPTAPEQPAQHPEPQRPGEPERASEPAQPAARAERPASAKAPAPAPAPAAAKAKPRAQAAPADRPTRARTEAAAEPAPQPPARPRPRGAGPVRGTDTGKPPAEAAAAVRVPAEAAAGATAVRGAGARALGPRKPGRPADGDE